MRTLACLIVAGVLAAAARGEVPKPMDKERLPEAQRSVQQLIRDLEFLQEEVIAEDQRTLYPVVEKAIDKAEQFRRALDKGAAWEKSFDELDHQVHTLLKAVAAVKPEQRGLTRSATRVAASDDQLHFLLFAGAQVEKVLSRQAQAFARVTKEFDRRAQFALGQVEGRAALLADIAKLAAAAREFSDTADRAGSERDRVKSEFAKLDAAWQRVLAQIQKVPAAENFYLLRSAGMLDELHEHLFRLLGMPGKRSGLVVST